MEVTEDAKAFAASVARKLKDKEKSRARAKELGQYLMQDFIAAQSTINTRATVLGFEKHYRPDVFKPHGRVRYFTQEEFDALETDWNGYPAG